MSVRPRPALPAGETVAAITQGMHKLKGVNEELHLMEVGWTKTSG